ncbi:predicted protein [Uncinocarpus reesii 1704]|uniref:Phospholipase/carboxylesterase/thioesterase domain-containing protein n=1 Tax=Uncinocarpus reesii (strain UAMH 1704) TaxID=336963 RepID=C4JPC8_UNCRE|nr:uncharacterized protein UREG_04510 [Uncinocarpus reesii 1704]EEP79664.1 predicted protein [Uncinocarpus reesii 1704]
METSQARFPDLHIVEPKGQHTHTAILLHGRGGHGPDFAKDLLTSTTSQGLDLASHFPTWRWVFPSAAVRWSVAFQVNLPAWFDVYTLADTNKRQDLQIQGLKESSLHVLDVLEHEISLLGGQSEKVILGGLSQGMSAALWTLLCSPGRVKGRLGAFIGCCGYLPFTQHIETAIQDYRSKYASESTTPKCVTISAFLHGVLGCPPIESKPEEVEAVLSTPVLLLHGIDDGIVKISLGRQACQLLREIGMEVLMREYFGAPNMGHWIQEPEGFDEIVTFLKSKIS